jgi:hypothetical protein
MTAEQIGYELTPRPVSLIARQQSTENWALMGPKAYDAVPEAERHRIEDFRPDGRNTGHMVLTSEDPLLLLDPNLRQLGGYGMKAPSAAIRIKSINPEDGTWGLDLGDLQISYILDGNDALWSRYEESLRGHAQNASDLARMLRRGWPYAKIRAQMINRH